MGRVMITIIKWWWGKVMSVKVVVIAICQGHMCQDYIEVMWLIATTIIIIIY